MSADLRFRVSDIMDLPSDVAEGCDMVYTDPPWEAGLVKMFETLANRDGGIDRPGNTIDGILKRLFELTPDGIPVFIEYSTKGHERVVDAGEAAGFKCTRVHRCIQTTKKPYVIIQFNSDMPSIDGAGGWEPIMAALNHHNPKRVFEPFAGHGQHTRRMVAHGAFVVASELNPARAAKLQSYFGIST